MKINSPGDILPAVCEDAFGENFRKFSGVIKGARGCDCYR